MEIKNLFKVFFFLIWYYSWILNVTIIGLFCVLCDKMNTITMTCSFGKEINGVWCSSSLSVVRYNLVGSTFLCSSSVIFCSFGLGCASVYCSGPLKKMSLEIYLDLFSQPCRSVYIFTKKNNIQFDHKKISLFEGMISYTIVWSLFVCTLYWFGCIRQQGKAIFEVLHFIMGCNVNCIVSPFVTIQLCVFRKLWLL